MKQVILGILLVFTTGTFLFAKTVYEYSNKSTELRRQAKYYLSATGDDNANGSIEAPWKSLKKISSIFLRPGDTVFFKKGNRFDGHFVVQGSGTKKKPIVISSYGLGERPIISGEVGTKGGGDFREAILVKNQSHLVFDGLEVQNERLVSRKGVKDTDAFGISVHNSSNAIMRNFTFRNMTFRDVFAVQPILEKSSFDAIQVSGLRFTCTRNRKIGNEKNIQDILIEDSFFTNLQRLGVQFKHSGGNDGVGNDSINRNMNIVVRNNEFSYNGGTGVLPNGTYNCLIENNLFDHPGANTDPRMPARGSSIWNYNSINTIMQYNVCLSTRGWLDSHGIHIDNNNKNTFIQYNYMEDCEGGFVEILRGNTNAVYRFNVSVNDGWRVNENWNTSNHTIWIHAVRHQPDTFKPNNHVYIHNNTVVINRPYKDRTFTSVVMDASSLFVYNNIFSSTGGGPSIGGHFAVQPASKTGTEPVITNNIYHGNVSQKFSKHDPNAVMESPLFSGNGHQKLAYKLTQKSSAINKGTTIQSPKIPGAGTGIFAHIDAYPTVDFYGNPIDLSSGSPNIGAYNGKKAAGDITFSNTDLMVVYPQSSNAKMYIANNGQFTDGDVELSLVDIKGQIHQSQKLDAIAMANGVAWDLNPKLSNGIYTLKLEHGDFTHKRRVVLFQ